MASNDRLEKLKKQIRDTSNQQLQIKNRIDETKEILSYHEQEQEQNRQEMVQFIQNIVAQSELAEAKERELIKDELARFSHRQTVMNEQIIALNDYLRDPIALTAEYDARRKELEMAYKNQEEAKQGYIRELDKSIDIRKSQVESLNEDIRIKRLEREKVVSETKKATFMNELKKTWVDKWFTFALVGFIALIIGGFAGWGIFTIVGNIFSSITSFISSFFESIF